MTIVLSFIAAIIACLCLINYVRIRDARRIKEKKIPIVNDDCIRAYQEAIKVVLPRVNTVRGLDSTAAIEKYLGFQLKDELWDFYPAIAMIRLCHLIGYEVEFRPMRTEHSPLKEGEMVSRMTKDEIDKIMYES